MYPQAGALSRGPTVAAVSHDHVIAVHGVGEADGLRYLVMQYIAGESLQDRLDRAGPLEVEEAVRTGRQTASGLAAAHVPQPSLLAETGGHAAPSFPVE